MKKHLMWFGGAYLLLAMTIVSAVFFWHYHREVKISEAEEHNQPFVEEDFRNSYWNGFWENHQSEYAQLFFDFMIMGALANLIARKHQAEAIRLEAKLDFLIEHFDLNPDEPITDDWQE